MGMLDTFHFSSMNDARTGGWKLPGRSDGLSGRWVSGFVDRRGLTYDDFERERERIFGIGSYCTFTRNLRDF